MTDQRRFRFTYDTNNGRVNLRVGRNRAVVHWIHRHELRILCDQLHDYADQLDRQEREAPARPTDATKQPSTSQGPSDRQKLDPLPKAPAVNIPPRRGTPIARTRAREEARRG